MNARVENRPVSIDQYNKPSIREHVSKYLDFDILQCLLLQSGGLLVGSVPLAAYIDQYELPAKFTPHNLDIFVNDSSGYADLLCGFVINSGYTLDAITDTGCHTFSSPEGLCVHVIFANMHAEYTSVQDTIEYVKTHLNLSPCMTWWNVNTQTLDTAHPILTRSMLMLADSDADKAQLEKYRARGFTLV